MARIAPLLQYARIAARRNYVLKLSSSEKAVQALVSLFIAAALFRQFKAIAVGPMPVRSSAAQLLIGGLASAWIILPCLAPIAIPLRALALYPLTWKQKAVYRIFLILQNWRVLTIIGISFISIAVLVRVPHALLVIAESFGVLAIAASIGVGCAIALEYLQIGKNRKVINSNPIEPHRCPLLRKDLRSYLRMTDFYVALAISLCAGFSEFFGNWISPVKAIVPLLLVALPQMPAFLNPFGLETQPELDRLLLAPTPYWVLLGTKHIALITLFLLSTLPLSLALIYQMPFIQFSITTIEICTIGLSCLIVGLSLMHLPRARQIRIRMVGSLISGSNMSTLFSLEVVVLAATIPVCEGWAVRYIGYSWLCLIISAIFFPLGAVYLWQLCKQDWPTSSKNLTSPDADCHEKVAIRY